MARHPEILSTIKSAPASYFVYSSLSFFGARHRGELPGMWFVRALAGLGRDAAAVRQTLYRMERERELVTRKVGRAKLYSASPYAKAEIDAGTAKIFERPARAWDGKWTIVQLAFSTAQRIERERVAALLHVEGFAQLGTNTYLHPRADGTRVRDALSARARPHVIVLRGSLANDDAIDRLVALWHVDRLAVRYRRSLGRLRELDKLIAMGRVPDEFAFAYRFAVVFEYLGVAWDDPRLPSRLLPRDWPGEKARQTAAHLYERLLPGALRHAERLLADAASGTNHR